MMKGIIKNIMKKNKKPSITIGVSGLDGLIDLAIPLLNNHFKIKNINRQFNSKYRLKNIVQRIFFFLWDIREVKLIYFVSIGTRTSLYARLARLCGKKVIFHWVGTDVYQYAIKKEKFFLQGGGRAADVHLACSTNLKEELQTMGISSKVLSLPPDGLSNKIAKMPEEHAVLCSIPDGRKEFYGYDISKKLISSFPDLKFYIVRSEHPELYPEKNVCFKGMLSRQEMDRLFDEISIVFRFPEHDGLSLIIQEATIKGKYMLYKYKHPYVAQVHDFSELCTKLENIIREKPTPNIEASKFGIKEYSQACVKKKLVAVITSLINT